MTQGLRAIVASFSRQCLASVCNICDKGAVNDQQARYNARHSTLGTRYSRKDLPG
jgi:hypothetical protein